MILAEQQIILISFLFLQLSWNYPLSTIQKWLTGGRVCMQVQFGNLMLPAKTFANLFKAIVTSKPYLASYYVSFYGSLKPQYNFIQNQSLILFCKLFLMKRFSIDSVLLKQYLKEPKPLTKTRAYSRDRPVHMPNYSKTPTPAFREDPIIAIREGAKSYNRQRSPTPVDLNLSYNLSRRNNKSSALSTPREKQEKILPRDYRASSFRIGTPKQRTPARPPGCSIPAYNTDKVIKTKFDSQDLFPGSSKYFMEDVFRIKTIQTEKKIEHQEEMREYLQDFKQTVKLLKTLPTSLPHPKINLPPHSTFKKTVILDLDETLIHCVFGQPYSHVKIPVEVEDGEFAETGINIRPYCLDFLRELSQICELIIFTASNPNYAGAVLDYLDPKNEMISHRLYRKDCTLYKERYFKDLRNINRDLSSVLIVDNSVFCYTMQLENGVPILPYSSDPNDCELPKLLEYLKEALESPDTRQFNSVHFRVAEFKRNADIDKLIKRGIKF